MAFNYGNRLLLDMNYGATVAYSLRKLSSTYNGPLLTIRRDSDNAETNIGFYRYTLDTQSIANFAGAGSAYVKVWYDQSGNGNNMQRLTTTVQPLIYSSGSIVMEGAQPAIYFTASYDMNSISSVNLPQPYSMIRVMKRLVADGKTGAYISTPPSNLNSISITGVHRANAGVNASFGTGTIEHQIIYNGFNSSLSIGAINNTVNSTINPGTNAWSGSITINNSREFTLQEYVLYPNQRPNYQQMIEYTNYFYRAY
jgi:hypothetical protein